MADRSPKNSAFTKVVLGSIPYDRYATFNEVILKVEKHYPERRYKTLNALQFLIKECKVHEIELYDEGRRVSYCVRIKRTKWYKNLQKTLQQEMKDKLTKHVGIDTPNMEEDDG